MPCARKQGVVIDNRLSLSENIAAVTCSCRFFNIVYNIQRICLFLTPYSTQLLVQATVLSYLDYSNSLLAGLLASAIRTLQLIQNASGLQPPQTLPRHHPAQFPPLAACHCPHQIQNIDSWQGVKGSFQLTSKRSSYPTSLPDSSFSNLRTPGASPSLHFQLPVAWNYLPMEVRTAVTLTTFKCRLKTHLFKDISPPLPTSL